jgi:hypothetical protein
MADKNGYLHVAWNHHNSQLNYSQSMSIGSLDLTEKMVMTGVEEYAVTYPQFYRLPSGNLIFLYRAGSSGNGNLSINYFDVNKRDWSKLQKNLIDGEGKRNAYWQAAISSEGTIHLSWVWRESWDVSTNHDVCYAKSDDGGINWKKSTGEKYDLPITVKNAEYACRIPEFSELINQTSMCVDKDGLPYIATYWRDSISAVPQYYLIYNDGKKWRNIRVSRRKTDFTLSGGGTKRIPISRPLILVDYKKTFYLIFRDKERNNFASVSICKDLESNVWEILDLTSYSLGMWEPTYDTELWKSENILHLFVQNVGQGDEEKLETIEPQTVAVLEWNTNN